MAKLSLCSSLNSPSVLPLHSPSPLHTCDVHIPQSNTRRFTVSAANSGGLSFNPIAKRCQTCGGQGAIECTGCKGTGRNKKNGNIFERWKCFDCQGFGMKSCPTCGKGGLTPEQRGER